MELDFNMMSIPLADWNEWTFTILILGGILFVGLYNMIVYLLHRRLKVYYFFGMICIFYVSWYSSKLIPYEVFPLSTLSDHHKLMIAGISANRMALHISLYTLYTLKMTNHLFEKRLKLGMNILLVLCIFMPLSLVYTESLIWVIELVNVIVQLYFSYHILKFFKNFYKDIRIIPAICYLFISFGTILQFIGLEPRDSTIYLAFFMIILQGIILSLHYNNLIMEVEKMNMTLERKVEERTADLIRKEQETTHLISSISHDLRTPISVVGGYIELLQSDPEAISEENKKYLSHSLVRLSQMEKLTLDLFTLSKISDKNYTFDLEEICIIEVLKQTEDLYTAQAKQKGITLKINGEAAVCIADRMRVLQVMDNLMMNALAYAKSFILITAIVVDDEVQITVRDDGTGIPPEDLPHVFERFFKKSQLGSGLGLSNVKELIQRMGGEVKVESEWNVGTSFSFTLPLKSPCNK